MYHFDRIYTFGAGTRMGEFQAWKILLGPMEAEGEGLVDGLAV